MAVVYLGLGSNLGNREDNLARAVKELKNYAIEVESLSSIIESDPVGGPVQGKFLNAVLKVNTGLLPIALLKACQSIEQRMGRIKTEINGPRLIDIDVLLYNRLQVKSPELTIPHPRMLQRDFVMRPLKEINPSLAKELESCAF